MKNQKGFSLIELLVVVIIIAIIAAIAIPSLLASRRAANEASAIGSMRTIHTANATYQAVVGGGTTYAVALTDLSGQGLIDVSLANATAAATDKSGFFFTYTPLNTAAVPTQFTMIGTPSAGVATGRNFFVDQSGVIRAAQGVAATVASAPIE